MSRTDIEIRGLQTHEDLQACIRLQKDTWGADFSELVPPALLMAVQRIGGVAAGAFSPDGTLIGFVFGMTGVEEGRLVHWSDMLAVRPEHRNRGLGERLKRYQRDTLLRLGVETVYWTFDPLESKNAYLNFAHLGVVAREYHVDLYGETGSALHRGIGTDRLVAHWEIGGERVRRRLDQGEPPPRADDIGDVPLVNATRTDATGPVSDEPDLELDAPRLRIAIPADIQALKDHALERAVDWRRKSRAAFTHYLGERGYTAVDVVREGDRSCYVLDCAGAPDAR